VKSDGLTWRAPVNPAMAWRFVVRKQVVGGVMKRIVLPTTISEAE
jgi:hypothetical protein